MESQTEEALGLSEAVELGAVDGSFFAEYFFPNTARSKTPPFLHSIHDELGREGNRHVSIQVFRGGSKTSTLRMFAARRIAYGISRTILYIGKSQDHAKRSTSWIMKQVQFNNLFANAYGLKKGKKWTSEECEISHTIRGHTITLIAIGITGSVRGVNIDDYRPDLIILDDVIDEENSNTPEQRKKINNLIFGAVDKSLIHEAEDPHAKLVMLQTPLDKADASELTQNDPEWHPFKFSCFDENGESRWPELLPTETLLRDKESAIRRNMLSLWLREMECTVIADEKRYFRLSDLNYWEVYPEGMVVSISIDPSPPKDEEPEKRKSKDPDPEVISVQGIFGKKRFLLEYAVITEPDPEKTVTHLGRLIRKWHPVIIGVETVAYQRTLQWYIEKAMNERRIPRVTIESVDDKRSKVKKIRQFYAKYAPDGEFYIHSSMSEFTAQFEDYPEVIHDDVIEAPVIGFQVLEPYSGEVAIEEVLENAEQERIDDLGEWRAAP